MHGTYLQNKISINNWRAKNRDEYNAFHRRYRNWKKIKMDFLQTFIDI